MISSLPYPANERAMSCREQLLFVLSLVLWDSPAPPVPENSEITDPAEAAKDPDFNIQGEYVGEGIGRTANTRKSGPR